MSIYRKNKKIIDLYRGDTEIISVFKGNDYVYGDPAPDYDLSFFLDGSSEDGLNILNTPDVRIGPGSSEGKCTWMDGSTPIYEGNAATNAVVESIGSGPYSFLIFANLINGRIIGFSSGADSTGFRIGVSNDGEFNYRTNLTGLSSNENSAFNGWVLCTVTSSGSEGIGKIYVNGEQQNDTLMPVYDYTGAGHTLEIGNQGLIEVTGGIGFFRLYKRVLSETEIIQISNFYFDYRPEDGESLLAHYDPQPQITITAAGGLVELQKNITASGFDLEQGSPTRQPEFVEGALNSVNAITYDDDYMYVIFNLNDSGNLVIHQALEVVAGGTALEFASILAMKSEGVTNSDWQIDRDSAVDTEFKPRFLSTDMGVNSISSNVDIIDGNIHIISLKLDFENNFIGLYIDGDLKVSSNNYNNKLDPVQEFRVMTNRTAGRFAKGNVGAIIVREITDTTIFEKDIGYLAWYYGITSQLPSNFTYKNTPPRKI